MESPHHINKAKGRGPSQAATGCGVGPPSLPGAGDDPYPSLSDYHDYEPQLEFDDTEVACATNAGTDPELEAELDLALDGTMSDGAIGTMDGTIEENFEEALGPLSLGLELGDDLERKARLSTAADFRDVAQHGIVDVVGDDSYGRKVIVVSACRLPSNKELNHAKLLSYLMFTLNQYVEQDYSLVYFHYGLNSKNKPPLSWLWQAYRAFDRKYKKNLKALYLVHPTNFIRVVYNVFRPAISVKFGKKIMYVNYLHELKEYLPMDQITIPEPVLEHDRTLMTKPSRPVATPTASAQFHTPLETQQFGVSLQFIKDNNGGDPVPPVLRQCVEFLSHPDALETEGLFRRSANVRLVHQLQSQFNHGETVQLTEPHLAAVLIKSFLRELEEPLMTFDLYDEIVQVQAMPKSERGTLVKSLVLEKLPEDNYTVLKFIIHFLAKVMDRSDLNKMTSANLAVVFGPNLIWHQNRQMSLSAIGPINTFTDYLLQNHHQLFIL
ncbi:rho GTPase-activating protein 1-like [Amphibalanus amphitrite]|uniref:rho GTPase-activating protein 1-like n=1 Tax=Amphibalanus amphitrite TaxID=1232801 RepID=UPI001C91B2C2|nr:rho GTPase-activating protein 1-like [Amphibalanus amphitrite]